MSIRFSHAFAFLLAACGAASILIPARALEGVRTVFATTLAPVSRPTGAIAGWMGARLNPDRPRADSTVPADAITLLRQNDLLRADNASLAAQLEALKRLNRDREGLGSVRERSVPARVLGLDGGQGGLRQILQVLAPSGSNIEEGMVAVSSQGLVGRVTSSVGGMARVLLTTDEESKVQAAFGRFVASSDGQPVFHRLSIKPLVVGAGSAGMKVTMLSKQDVTGSGLQVGDWVVVDDENEFPYLLQGFRIGHVTRIEDSIVRPLFAEIYIDPPTDLRRLREVMIVNRP